MDETTEPNDDDTGNDSSKALKARGGPSLADILIESGRLSREDEQRILVAQREFGLRFGEAALKLGVLTRADLDYALARQFDYPYLIAGEDFVAPDLVAALNPFGDLAEQLRMLRSQIYLRRTDAEERPRGLSVTSPERGEGRSFIAANLAIVFAQMGERTLLVDADLRNPRQHHLFQLPDTVGLTSVLAGRGDFESIFRVASLGKLSVLPAGPMSPNPQELLCRPLFGAFLRDLLHMFDVVIVDTPAWAECADAQIISARTGAAVTVIRADHTAVSKATELVAALGEAKVDVMGAVLNRF